MVEIIRHWALAENVAILFSHSRQGVNSHEQLPFMETDPDVLIICINSDVLFADAIYSTTGLSEWQVFSYAT